MAARIIFNFQSTFDRSTLWILKLHGCEFSFTVKPIYKKHLSATRRPARLSVSPPWQETWSVQPETVPTNYPPAIKKQEIFHLPFIEATLEINLQDKNPNGFKSLC